MEEELKQSEENYRSIFENVQEGIFRSTLDGRITLCNQALATMFGYESPEEMQDQRNRPACGYTTQILTNAENFKG